MAEEGNQGGVGSDCVRTAAPDAAAVFVQPRQMPLLCSFSRARCRCCVRSAAPDAAAVFVQPRQVQLLCSFSRAIRKAALSAFIACCASCLCS